MEENKRIKKIAIIISSMILFALLLLALPAYAATTRREEYGVVETHGGNAVYSFSVKTASRPFVQLYAKNGSIVQFDYIQEGGIYTGINIYTFKTTGQTSEEQYLLQDSYLSHIHNLQTMPTDDVVYVYVRYE